MVEVLISIKFNSVNLFPLWKLIWNVISNVRAETLLYNKWILHLDKVRWAVTLANTITTCSYLDRGRFLYAVSVFFLFPCYRTGANYGLVHAVKKLMSHCYITTFRFGLNCKV